MGEGGIYAVVSIFFAPDCRGPVRNVLKLLRIDLSASYQPRTQALWFVYVIKRAREKKWKIRREAPGRIRIQNGGSVFCKCSVLFILLLK